MTPTQREAALRLTAEHPTLFMNDLLDWCDDAFHLLRELLAEPQVGDDVAWLWTHCKALGMKRKSLSGSMRDDIALYVVDLRELASEPVEPAPGYCKHCKQYTIEEPLPAEPYGLNEEAT